MRIVHEIDGFAWSGEKQSWVDVDGKIASRKKDRDLEQKSKALHQKELVGRLDAARGAFESMSGKRERKAVHEWLRETYEL